MTATVVLGLVGAVAMVLALSRAGGRRTYVVLPAGAALGVLALVALLVAARP